MKSILVLACLLATTWAQSLPRSLMGFGAGAAGGEASSSGGVPPGLGMLLSGGGSGGAPGMSGMMPGMSSLLSGGSSSGGSSGLLSGMFGAGGGGHGTERAMTLMAAQGSGGAGNIVRMQVMLKVMGDCQLSQMQQMLAISGNLGDDITNLHRCKCMFRMPMNVCLMMRNM